ncbi:hypothetical protein D3C77_466950 [compost metagenome]
MNGPLAAGHFPGCSDKDQCRAMIGGVYFACHFIDRKRQGSDCVHIALRMEGRGTGIAFAS